MKQFFYYFFLTITATLLAFPQSRFLVTPNDEVIPITKGESALQAAKRYTSGFNTFPPCPTNQVYDGFHPERFPLESNFGATHKDVLGQWFQAKFSGRIDTIFWMTLGNVGSYDSTLSIRIFNSNIRPGVGPGNPPYPPPCQPWGYYVNTNDSDNYITPFKDEATDTNWHSTIPGVPSFDPLGEELWGNGGFIASNHRDSINFVALEAGGDSLIVNADDVFFITMRVNSPNHHIEDDERTEFAATMMNSLYPEFQEYYPSRNWKFYEHPAGASNCSGYPNDSIPAGWIARGGFDTEPTDVAAYLWWYSITTVENIPPQLDTFYQIDEAPNEICINEICPLPNNPGNLYYVQLQYSTLTGTIDSTNFIMEDSIFFCATLPELEIGDRICYSILVRNSEYVYYFMPQTCRRNYGGSIQNGYKFISPIFYDWTEIGDPTNEVTNWFLDSRYPASGNAMDDGTSGPFDLGETFRFFDNDVRYVWIGVNGGVAFSATADDTIHINYENGYAQWSIPSYVSSFSKHPKNYVAALQQDFKLNFSPSAGIYAKKEGTQFIIQWDSLYSMDNDTTHTFQLVLDFSDSSIQFRYKAINTSSELLDAVVGLHADSSQWFLMSMDGQPGSRVPMSGRAFKLKPVEPLEVSEQNDPLPLTFSLEQNYPNPFNPSTEFAFDIAEHSFVTLKVYDLLGKEITTIVNEKMLQGGYSKRWQASGIPSGVYFYRITATPIANPDNAFTETRKMILMR